LKETGSSPSASIVEPERDPLAGRGERRRIGMTVSKAHNPASPSPVTDGDNVFVFFHGFRAALVYVGGQRALEAAAWPLQRVLTALGASPILVDDLVILPCDQDNKLFYDAVERQTGRVRWRVERPQAILGLFRRRWFISRREDRSNSYCPSLFNSRPIQSQMESAFGGYGPGLRDEVNREP
jgi:hypothetical protein